MHHLAIFRTVPAKANLFSHILSHNIPTMPPADHSVPATSQSRRCTIPEELIHSYLPNPWFNHSGRTSDRPQRTQGDQVSKPSHKAAAPAVLVEALDRVNERARSRRPAFLNDTFESGIEALLRSTIQSCENPDCEECIELPTVDVDYFVAVRSSKNKLLKDIETLEKKLLWEVRDLGLGSEDLTNFEKFCQQLEKESASKLKGGIHDEEFLSRLSRMALGVVPEFDICSKSFDADCSQPSLVEQTMYGSDVTYSDDSTLAGSSGSTPMQSCSMCSSSVIDTCGMRPCTNDNLSNVNQTNIGVACHIPLSTGSENELIQLWVEEMFSSFGWDPCMVLESARGDWSAFTVSFGRQLERFQSLTDQLLGPRISQNHPSPSSDSETFRSDSAGNRLDCPPGDISVVHGHTGEELDSAYCLLSLMPGMINNKESNSLRKMHDSQVLEGSRSTEGAPGNLAVGTEGALGNLAVGFSAEPLQPDQQQRFNSVPKPGHIPLTLLAAHIAVNSDGSLAVISNVDTVVPMSSGTFMTDRGEITPLFLRPSDPNLKDLHIAMEGAFAQTHPGARRGEDSVVSFQFERTADEVWEHAPPDFSGELPITFEPSRIPRAHQSGSSTSSRQTPTLSNTDSSGVRRTKSQKSKGTSIKFVGSLVTMPAGEYDPRKRRTAPRER
ncbi:hypothetical protein BJ742DRAFT_825978 [Cladochytrium replicatum]|nr:hypothetical protein BJ742DRAFT_825978 [Cladochytrium replicatum]